MCRFSTGLKDAYIVRIPWKLLVMPAGMYTNGNSGLRATCLSVRPWLAESRERDTTNLQIAKAIQFPEPFRQADVHEEGLGS